MQREYKLTEGMSFCLVSIFIAGEWKPMGLARKITDSIITAQDMAEYYSNQLKETGVITCIIPTEAWSFIAINVSTYPIKVVPFLNGVKLSYEQTNFEFAKLQAVQAIS